MKARFSRCRSGLAVIGATGLVGPGPQTKRVASIRSSATPDPVALGAQIGLIGAPGPMSIETVLAARTARRAPSSSLGVTTTAWCGWALPSLDHPIMRVDTVARDRAQRGRRVSSWRSAVAYNHAGPDSAALSVPRIGGLAISFDDAPARECRDRRERCQHACPARTAARTWARAAIWRQERACRVKPQEGIWRWQKLSCQRIYANMLGYAV
jgi:hypothetical protein